ncbi:MAG TPA: nitrate reductase subunit beta, partial [Rhodocyclaceae bacterium]|nr:nitrate reductase subunit beta [Rhodocyclaceae bacterium]
SESCVGRIRYNGIILYDADRLLDAASADNEQDLYKEHLDLFVDPYDPAIIKQALADGVPQAWIDAAQKSPIYKMAVEWKIAFPLHPEFRTLPMIWYVPPLSPVQSQLDQKTLPTEADGVIPKASAMRLPVQYLANLLTAGKEEYIVSALNRLIAMRSYMRSVNVEGTPDLTALKAVGMDETTAKEMYRYLAIANYEDSFVIPTSHQEIYLDDAHGFQGQNGFSFGNPASGGESDCGNPFPNRRTTAMENSEDAPLASVFGPRE